MQMIREILPIILACLAAIFAYRLAKTIRIEKAATKRIGDFAKTDELSALDRFGQQLLDRLGLSPSSWSYNLRWAHIGGYHTNVTVGGIFARGLLLALGGIAYITLLGGPPVAWFAIPILFYYPYRRMVGKAKEVRKDAERSLPEVAALIAAEAAAGTSPDQALARASEMPGPVSVLLSEAVAESRRTGRPLFSRPPTRGALVDTLGSERMNQISTFANQIDMVAGKGVEASALMARVADGFARQYRTRVRMAVEQLENTLLFPMLIFFFAPFLLALLAPLMINLFAAF